MLGTRPRRISLASRGACACENVAKKRTIIRRRCRSQDRNWSSRDETQKTAFRLRSRSHANCLVCCLTVAGVAVVACVLGRRASSQDPVTVEPWPTVHLMSQVKSAQQARTWLKLQTTCLVFPKDTPLQAVLSSIKAVTKGKDRDDPGVQVYVDPLDLQEADRTMESSVLWNVEGVPLATSLRYMLKQLNLRYDVSQEGLVVIHSKDSLDAPADPTALILDTLSQTKAGSCCSSRRGGRVEGSKWIEEAPRAERLWPAWIRHAEGSDITEWRQVGHASTI